MLLATSKNEEAELSFRPLEDTGISGGRARTLRIVEIDAQSAAAIPVADTQVRFLDSGMGDADISPNSNISF